MISLYHILLLPPNPQLQTPLVSHRPGTCPPLDIRDYFFLCCEWGQTSFIMPKCSSHVPLQCPILSLLLIFLSSSVLLWTIISQILDLPTFSCFNVYNTTETISHTCTRLLGIQQAGETHLSSNWTKMWQMITERLLALIHAFMDSCIQAPLSRHSSRYWDK